MKPGSATPSPSNIFKGTAQYYAQYRRPYSKQLFEDIVSYYRLGGKGRLLDLGCGTGELTIPLASHFQNAIGLDPSSDMLAVAKSKADEQRVLNITWTQGKAEDLDEMYGPLHLTIAADSFHWMNQALVFEKVYGLTEKGGGMAIIGDASTAYDEDKAEDWKAKRKEVISNYLGEDRRAGDHLYKDFIPEERPFKELIAESAFRTFDLKVYPYTTERTIDEMIGFLYSTSYAAKRLFGEHADEFEHELRHELLQLVPSNKFIEGGTVNVYLLRK